LGKRLLLHFIIGLLLLFVGYGAHFYIIIMADLSLPYNLLQVYLFFAIVSILICISFELLASIPNGYHNQLGFIYMATMALKIVLFCVVYRELLFYGTALSKTDSLSLLIPIFIFLFYEVFIISRILNRKP